MTASLAIRTNTVSKLSTDQLDMILLDGSGSMSSKWWPMLEAIDAYIAGLKTAHVKSHIVLDVFDSTDRQLNMRDGHIDQWKTFAEDPIGAHFGMTPLMDAIVLMGAKVRDLNPPKCAVTIITDGNDTLGFNLFANIHKARSVLDWLRAQGFTVTFIGCDFDNDRQARALGASPHNSIGVRKELLTDAAKRYAEKRVHNVRTGEDINFTQDEKTKFGGYLSRGGGA
jgi:hypothetical protein